MNFLDAAGLARFFSGLGQKFAALSHTHGTADIEDGAITTDKIANMAVTTSKLGNKCVANGNLGDMSVQEGKIFPQAVTTTKIRDGAVTEDKLDAALKAKINASGGGATVLYETSSPTALTPSGTDSVTLATTLRTADPAVVIVNATNGDGASIPFMFHRPANGWSLNGGVEAHGITMGGLGMVGNNWSSLGNPLVLTRYQLTIYNSSLSVLEAVSVYSDGATQWATVATETPIYVYKVVGLS